MATSVTNPNPDTPLPAGQKAVPVNRSIMHKSALTLYRIFAVITLYAVLLGILSYAFIMGFYAVNSTWAAPVILSASDEKSLDFISKLVTSRQSIEDLKVDATRMQSTLTEMTKHRADLVALDPELAEAIQRERTHDRATGSQLSDLDAQKKTDNQNTQAMLKQSQQTAARIRKDLAAGLITKADADTQLAALTQAQSAYTDSRIGEVMLTDSILDKTSTGTRSMDVLEKQAELRSEIAQLDVTIAVSDKQLQEDNRQIERLHDAITTAKLSPYYLSTTGNPRIYFAFVPYDNQVNAKVGTPIYDCYLDMVLCRKVGTVKQIFLGEQDTTHPIFKTQVRGFTIQMDLSHPNSAKSKTVFLGRKPLLF